jgi:hypothetical protein
VCYKHTSTQTFAFSPPQVDLPTSLAELSRHPTSLSPQDFRQIQIARVKAAKLELCSGLLGRLKDIAAAVADTKCVVSERT